MKVIDANTKVYYLLKVYPEIKDILMAFGFICVKNKACIHLFARVMTLKSAAKVQKIDYIQLKEEFETHGFFIEEKE
ncbi:MAG: DUF1858 domain-containing protein [Bacilli bacterium]